MEKVYKNSPCHPELAAPLVADEKEAYKGGCSQSISGSSHRQKCVTICNVSGKEVLDKVCWAESPTLKYCWGFYPNLQKAISSASRKVAFTLAEVLITLGIIGVVAAMTLPTLLANHRKNVAEARLAKFYSAINQAVLLSERENGEHKDWDDLSINCDYDEETQSCKEGSVDAIQWYNIINILQNI